MKVTNEIIEAGKSKYGGWSKNQLQLLWIEWKPLKGWKNIVIGKEINSDIIFQFLKLKDKHI